MSIPILVWFHVLNVFYSPPYLPLDRVPSTDRTQTHGQEIPTFDMTDGGDLLKPEHDQGILIDKRMIVFRYDHMGLPNNYSPTVQPII